MGKGLSLAGLALLAILGCRMPSPMPKGPLPGVSAVYVYSDVVRDPGNMQAFLDFARQGKLNRVYLQSSHLVRECPESLGDFIGLARREGISVTLLAGRAAWATEPGHGEALRVAREARAFADGLGRQGRAAPEAIQFDVEPYLLPGWQTDTQALSNQYLDLFEKLREALGGRLRLQACIPFWFDRVKVRRRGRTRPLSEWILDAADGAVVMDYRDSAHRLVSGVQEELDYASRKGQAITLAINLSPSTERGTTFHGQSEARIRRALEDASEILRSYNAFSGFALFHYGVWTGEDQP